MPVLEGSLDGSGMRVCIVVARWNEFVTRKLLEGAQSCLGERGLTPDDITVAWVPGAFEVPTAANWAARSGRFDAVICLGAVVRGETPHFEYVAGGATRRHRPHRPGDRRAGSSVFSPSTQSSSPLSRGRQGRPQSEDQPRLQSKWQPQAFF